MMMERTSRGYALAAISAVALVACGNDGGAAATMSATGDPAAIGHVIGSSDAPVTIIEYASPTCPACKYFHDTVLPEIQENYISTGKVRFVYREYPVHDIDVPAYALALCAGEDKFFPVMDDLFEHQSGITDAARNGVLQSALMAVGERHGITGKDQFDACMADKDIRTRLADTYAVAEKDGIDSTPTFMFDGQIHRFEGDIRSVEGFSAKLDELLANAAGQ
jgi:protein-disulfide isomerase